MGVTRDSFECEVGDRAIRASVGRPGISGRRARGLSPNFQPTSTLQLPPPQLLVYSNFSNHDEIVISFHQLVKTFLCELIGFRGKGETGSFDFKRISASAELKIFENPTLVFFR